MFIPPSDLFSGAEKNTPSVTIKVSLFLRVMDILGKCYGVLYLVRIDNWKKRRGLHRKLKAFVTGLN